MGPQRSVRWINCVFMTACVLPTITVLPWYVLRFGLTGADLLMFAFWILASAMGITVGYHRLFAHRSYKANTPLTWLALFFGASAFQQSALDWASQHRRHHRCVDDHERDPYSIKRGFFYAHMGWVLFFRQPRDHSNVKDLLALPLLRFQHNFFYLCVAFAGLVVPLVVSTAVTGHFFASLLLSVAARVTLVYQATFSVNSVCHSFGSTRYDPGSTARDHWIVALLTFGEGYHNFHHRFPSDYRNAVRWYQYDPGKWMIAFFAWLGWATDLRRVPHARIEAAERGWRTGHEARESFEP